MLAHVIVKESVNSTFESELTANQKIYERMHLLPGTSLITVNSQQVDTEKGDLYSVLDMLSGDAKMMDLLAANGVATSKIHPFLALRSVSARGLLFVFVLFKIIAT